MATSYNLSEVLIDYVNFKIKRDEMHKRVVGSHVQEQLNWDVKMPIANTRAFKTILKVLEFYF